jgi:ATP-binding cassette, subfamily C, bacterial
MPYKFVRQEREADSGVACLTVISQHYGHKYTLNQMHEIVGNGQLSTTLLGLCQGAEKLGFRAYAVKTSPEIFSQINKLPLPAIIHWGNYHWIVLYGVKGQKFVVADPAVGVRYLSKKELVAGWSDGVMLLIEKNSKYFINQPQTAIIGFSSFFQRVPTFLPILLEVFMCVLVSSLPSLASPYLSQILSDDVVIQHHMK